MPHVESHYGAFIVHGRGYGPEGMLVQSDWDFPATAGLFGWSIRRVQKDRSGRVRHLKRTIPAGCLHEGTDGTVDCRECGVTASDFIGAAGEFLGDIAT